MYVLCVRTYMYVLLFTSAFVLFMCSPIHVIPYVLIEREEYNCVCVCVCVCVFVCVCACACAWLAVSNFSQ